MEEKPTDIPTVSQEVKKTRPPLLFLMLLVALIGIFVYGLKWIFSLGSEQVGSAPFLVFDYAVGLSMIFLPCTLPLAFVIVPLVMGKSYQKGIGMTLSFGLGVTITLSFYGILIGLLGQALGIHQVETAKNILYAAAGIFAILFALGELRLIRFAAPVYGGGVPQFIMKQKDIAKALFLGLFLGNVGVGCPNPLFNAVIIPQIIATGDPFQGWLIMFVQALGRITPLFILAFLAILGINATKFLVAHKDTVSKITAWSTIYVGGFLLTLGLFGHDWWVASGMHTFFEMVTQENFITNLLGSKVAELGHTHGTPTGAGLFGLPIALGTPFILLVWIFPMLWYWLYKKKAFLTLPIEQQAFEKRYTRLVGWFFGVTSLLLIVVFGYYLPHMFAAHWSKMGHEAEEMPQGVIESDFHVTLSSSPSAVQAGKPFNLKIALHDKSDKPITDLQVSHERILHVILISEDMEEFKHVHPEDSGLLSRTQVISGEFSIPLTLSKAGRYRVLADASRKGMGEVSDNAWLEVLGKRQLAVITKDLNRTRIFDGYEVTLGMDSDKIKAGEDAHLSYNIKKGGIAVYDTDAYLGADMHVALASVDLSTMIHTHGTRAEQKIIASYILPYPGIWKIYGQFLHLGRVITTEFMIEVEPEETQTIQMRETEVQPHAD